MKLSCWHIFRFIFVLFSLYFISDVFYRWDGFKYYASFTEFLPGVALASILWSIVAAVSAMMVWLTLRIFEWFCARVGWKIKIEHSFLFTTVYLFCGAMAWFARKLMGNPFFSLTLVLTVLFCITLIALILSWRLRNRAVQWVTIIQERITPLVWLFIMWLIISVPLVAYHTWGEKADNALSQEMTQLHLGSNSRPNIILVTFDTLTSRNMSVYGYEKETTPFMTEWAKNATVFTKLEAESHITTPTVASLMTGKRLWTHRTYHLRGSNPVKISTENLPLLLKNHGYNTMAFVVNTEASVNKLGIESNFDIAPLPSQFYRSVSLFGSAEKLLYQLFGDKIRLHDWILQSDFILHKLLRKLSGNEHITQFPPEKAFRKFLWTINDNFPEPFFAWIHLYPPHDPYLPPEPYLGMFDSSSELRSYNSQMKVKEMALRYRSKFQYFPPEIKPIIEVLEERYNEFIRYSDKQFEDFILSLKTSNKLKNAVIILSSDHGESFSHGYIQHSGFHLYEQVTNVPLIIKEVNQSEGRIINDLVGQIDIPATILELADITVPSWMEGRSLLPYMRGIRLEPRPLFSMALDRNPSNQHEITKGTIAIWEGDYKLIHYLEQNKSLLFNLRKDPEEINNLFDKEPGISQRLLTLIQDNLKKSSTRNSKGE